MHVYRGHKQGRVRVHIERNPVRRDGILRWPMSYHPFKHRPTREAWFRALMRRQNSRCGICGHRFPEPGELHPDCEAAFIPTFDHILPRSHGGPDEFANFRLAHRSCNFRRGDGTSEMQLPPGVPKVLRVAAKRAAVTAVSML